MNILLVNPPSPFLLDDRVFPPLGLLQVASVLEHAGHHVKVADLAGSSDPTGDLQPHLSWGWDVYGITATTPQFPTAVALLHKIHEYQPDKRVLLGGPHATVMPGSCKMFDCVIRGDGELAILSAIKADAPALIDEASGTQKGFVRWAWPARHLIDLHSYQYSLRGLKGTSMMLSQGCPYSCLFCCGRTNAYYRRVRSRSVDDVVEEMKHLVDTYGIRAVMAFDDEVNLMNSSLLEFCKKIKPLNMKFRAFVKANLFTDQQAEAMAEAGFVDVCTGVESGDDRILGVIQKQTTREINKKYVDLVRKHGMRSKAFTSLGHPGETRESAENLKDWLLWARPDDFDVTVITVYPGTPLWEQREKLPEVSNGHQVCRYMHKSLNKQENGATLYFEELDYSSDFAFYKGRPKEYISHVWTPDLSKTDLVALRDEIEDDVRTKLGIPYPQRFSGDHLSGAENFEHSMGAGVTKQDSRVQLRAAEAL